MNGSRQRRKNASLFEAMSKAPQNVEPAPARAPAVAFWRRVRQPQAPAMMVAEPLTEEEAQAELSAQRAVRDEIDRRQRDETAAREAERDARRKIAQEQKEARQRAKHAAKQARAAARAGEAQSSRPIGPTQNEVYYPFLRAMRGRLVVTLNTMTAMIVAVVIAAVGMGGYFLGHRVSNGGTSEPTHTTLAGIVPTTTGDGDTPQSPLPSLAVEPAAKPSKPSVQPPTTPELKRLLTPRKIEPTPPAIEPTPGGGGVRANAPTSLTLDASLNYLQIESFLVGGDETPEKVRADLVAVRKYLAERGVRTIAKRRSRDYVLFSSEGFPKGPEGASARASFAIRIENLGREYRRAGGRYEFKKCYFVSANEVAKGQSE